MSSVNYLFGNVDESGKLEQEDENIKELKEILENEENQEYLSKVLDISLEKPTSSNDSTAVVKPLENAVDYQDMQEMVEDLNPLPAPVEFTFKPIIQQPIHTLPKKTVQHGRLKFSEIFAARIQPTQQQFRQRVVPVYQDGEYYLQKDQAELFMKPMSFRFAKPKEEPIEQEVEPVKRKSTWIVPVVLDNWEDRIIWDPEDVVPDEIHSQVRTFRNEKLDEEDWTNAIVWDDTNPPKQPEFHLDDPTLVIVESEVERIKNENADAVPLFKKLPDGKVVDRFNISDDYKYEQQKTKLARIRQSHGPVKLQHSMPAIKLHPAYFKPLLHVKELRSFHRPSMKFPLNEPITFSRVKAMKKKKLKAIDPAEMMRTPKDLSLKDTSKFVLVEYCEEYPPAIQNIGMATLIHNYYRKKDEKDNFIPKLPNGGPFILEGVDTSPFFGFGDVEPGQTLQVLYNNLVRAPIFAQDVPQTDFLAIRHTYQGITKYFLREIPNLYVAGQCYPVQEVPRPQARKITQSLKLRLQVVAYRMMRQDPLQRISFTKLKAQFPMFSEIQIRQKLKEFAQYSKKGENTGWWKLKPGVLLLDEDGIRKLVTPESICLNESTLVAQQRLKDAGYGAEDMKEENEDEERESHLDIEIQLAPWTTTKNFLIAATGKGMVQLFGPGDPTGCGEGFSYIRASMKEMFFHHNETEESRNKFIHTKKELTLHKYSIVEQQQVYRAEINRIWNAQLKSLSARESDKKDPLSSLKAKKAQMEKEEEQKRQQDMNQDPSSPRMAPSSPPAITQQDNEDNRSDIGEGQSVHGSTLANKNKVLVINRLVKNSSGDFDWKSEVITDGRVINAYLRHRKMIEKLPTVMEGQPEKEIDLKDRVKRRTHAHVVRLQIKQGKRPPFKDDEDFSESELPLEVEQKPLPVVLKIPTSAAEKQAMRKKRGSQADTSIPNLVFRLTSKRRTSPECDFSEILEKIVSEIIAIPEAGVFCRAVSQHQYPDYYNLIKNPLSLEQVREKIRNFKYLTATSFQEDLKLIESNCVAYNGATHPLSNLAASICKKAQEMIDNEREKIERLENEIKSGLDKAPGTPARSETAESQRGPNAKPMDIDLTSQSDFQSTPVPPDESENAPNEAQPLEHSEKMDID